MVKAALNLCKDNIIGLLIGRAHTWCAVGRGAAFAHNRVRGTPKGVWEHGS